MSCAKLSVINNKSLTIFIVYKFKVILRSMAIFCFFFLKKESEHDQLKRSKGSACELCQVKYEDQVTQNR